ncbi:efflux RND transporter permease subunit [Candidatus Peregrinibacteria bacterium]|nr:efflux RND transporter permease subunit [Candidatus Peregrinibacteria bacterium]
MPEKEQNSDSLYLQQLEFKPRYNKIFLNFFLKNVRVIYLMIIGILLWGVVSFGGLTLESNPEVKIPFGVISVALPGASPSDVEELVIKKIENKVVNLSGIKTVNSTASNGFGTVSVEFRAEEDLKDAIRRLRDAVDTVRAELPTDATDPVVNEVSFDNTPVWTMVVSGPYDNFTLRRFADDIDEELSKLAGTSDVIVSGGDIAEIRVSYDPTKLDLYGLTMDQINATIRSSNLAMPLGELDLGSFRYNLRVDSKFQSVADLRNLPISSIDNSIIYLKDVATVVERAQERESSTLFSVNGSKPQNAITISVTKKTGASIVELSDQGKAKIDQLKADKLPQNLSIETTYDVAETIREDFNNLFSEGTNTILLVTFILFLFVGLKEAFTAGIVIPLVFATTFGLMLIFGQTLNFLSLFSLILSLGLLVDDAIVVVQATKQYMATGKFTPEQAVLLVFKDFFALILTTSLTTIFAFLPLVLASGIIGQFIRSIPIVVTLTLIASTIIALIINHPMAAILERFRPTRIHFKLLILLLLAGAIATLSNIIMAVALIVIVVALLIWYFISLKKALINNEELLIREEAFPELIKEKLHHHYSEDVPKTFWTKLTTGVVRLEKILPIYESILRWLMDKKSHSYFAIILAILLFAGAAALPATGILKSEFLPASDEELMYIDVEGSPGMSIADTTKVVEQVEAILLQEKVIHHFSEVIGEAGVNISGGISSGGGAKTQTNRAQFAVNLVPEDERPDLKSYQYASELRKKVEAVEGAKVTLQELRGGPPAGADFEVKFTGEDMNALQKIANEYKVYLAEIPGTVNEKTSLNLSPGEITFQLKPEEMQLRGITSAQLASTLRTAISSAEITKIVEGEDDVKIIAEYQSDKVDSLESLKALPILSPRGQKFQLAEVVDIQLGSSLTSISRTNQKRVVTLSSSVEAPVLPAEVLTKFQEILAAHPLPAGYNAEFGGQNDTNAESIYSILRAMLVAFILIIATLVIQFNSFRKAILVLFTIPLAMTGVFIGLTSIGFTLSFPTLIGIVALFGIVVKNAIILIDKINLNLKVGIPFQEAIIDAAKSRLEAIFLTSSATIIGMIPITLYDETWEGLGAALIFGLAASTFLTLLLIPTLFNLLFAKSAQRDEKIRALQAQAKLHSLQNYKSL